MRARIWRGLGVAGSGLAVLAKVFVPLALLIALGLGGLYVRLLLGPVTIKALAEPITRGIAQEFPSLAIAIEDGVVQLNDQGRIEFRLRNVKISDQDGAPVAVSPFAAVEISHDALWSGRLTPSKVTLLEPRLLVFASENSLALSFFRPDEEPPRPAGAIAAPARAAPAAVPAAAGAGVPSVLRQLDIARVIADTTWRARRGLDATSYLKAFGMRDAQVIIDHGGTQGVLRLASAEIGLDHKRRRSTITGAITFDSPRGPWTLDLTAEDNERARTLVLTAKLRDLIPTALAPSLPQIGGLDAFDATLSGDATFEISSAGELLGGQITLGIGRGRLTLPRLSSAPIRIDAGQIDLRYDRANRRLEVAPSTLVFGGSRATLIGALAASTDSAGAEIWRLDLTSTEGRLASAEPGGPPVPLDRFALEGRYRTGDGVLDIARLELKAGGAEVAVAGTVGTAQTAGLVDISGRIGAMTLPAFKALWPAPLAPGARSWVAENVQRGQIQGGQFRVLEQPQSARRGQQAEQRMSAALEVTDVQLRPLDRLPPVTAPRVLVRLEGNTLEVAAPDAAIGRTANRRLALKAVRFAASAIDTEQPQGEITGRLAGPLGGGIELLEEDVQEALRSAGLTPDTVDGRIEGQLRFSMPLLADLPAEAVRLEGKLRVSDGRARQVLASYDMQGATLTFDITEKAVDTRGQFLLQGVPVKLAWQRITGAPADKQPPLRLTASLDAADRGQLGLDVNHAVIGEVPVEVTIAHVPRGQPQVRVRADLTNADLVLENLAWRKPPGRAALLQYDVAKGTRHKTELQNFKLVGDDIAIDGWMALDANNKLREFVFPDFSINVVSRLEIEGQLRNDHVWEVKARGSTYDGRDFFRSLFSVGQLTEKPLPARKDEPGLDLKADIDNVLGFSDSSLKSLKLQVSKRAGRLTSLIARGMLEGGRPLDVGLQQVVNGPRKLVAISDDAGQAFKLVGFYPNMRGGRMRLEVNLDGRGAAEKTGVLDVRNYAILGDPVVSEVLQVRDETAQGAMTAARGQPRYVRQVIEFDVLHVPFSVGNGQFALEEADVRGPLLGANLRGKADFRQRTVNLAGTYVPLQALNAALGAIPGIGQLLTGPRGDGVFGITFAVQGPMDRPQVIVNPAALVAPGIFRDLFQLSNPSTTVTAPREEPKKAKPAETSVRSSSTPAGASAAPAKAPARSDAPRGPQVAPEVGGAWTSETTPAKKKAAP